MPELHPTREPDPATGRVRSPGAVPMPALPDPQAYGPEDCAADLFDALPLAMAALRAGVRRNIEGALSVPQFRCLAFIDRTPGASVSEVTAFLGVTMATTSAMIDRLGAAGYIDIGVSEQDRRRSVLHASSKGRALLERMRRHGRLELAAQLAGLQPAELQTLREAAHLLQRSFRRG